MRYSLADQLGSILKSYRERSQQHTAFNISPASPPVPSSESSSTLPPPPPLPQSGLQPPRSAMVPPVIPPPAQRPAPMPQRPAGVPSAPSQRIPAQPSGESGSNAAVTQSYGPPVAPQSAPPGRPANPQSSGFQSLSPQTGDSSQLYRSRPLSAQDSRQYQSYSSGGNAELDLVTIGLAVIAFFAVACLIPLYIAVLQAYAGA